jgi:hypothetical protein
MNGRAWQVLRDLPSWQVTQIPRRPHACPGAEGGQVVLTFPSGARAQPLPPGQASSLLARMPCWMQLAGIADALLAGPDDSGRRDRDIRPSLEDGLMSAWSGPFAWLVLTEPVPVGRFGELAEEVSQAQQGTQRFDSPPAQLAVRRLSARHAELRQAAATGLWRVRLVAGGPAPQAAAQVAGLLCDSADLDGLPYALAPVPGGGGLDEALENTFLTGRALPAVRDVNPGLPLPRARSDPDISAPAWPFFASSRLVTALTRPPARELPGLRFVLRPDFDVMPETAVDAAVGFRSPVISARVGGRALASHVAAAMHAALDEDRWLCHQQEPEWLAPPYRWALALDSLRAQHRRDPESGPHPRTAEWEATFSRAIPGQNCASQLETVQRWLDTDQRNQQEVRAVGYGPRRVSAIEQAVGARAGDPDWEQCLAGALTAIQDCSWPLDLLRPAGTGR